MPIFLSVGNEYYIQDLKKKILIQLELIVHTQYTISDTFTTIFFRMGANSFKGAKTFEGQDLEGRSWQGDIDNALTI